MNIYLSFLQSKINHPIPAYSFWEYYIKNGIVEGGDEWQEGEVDWAEGLLYTLDKTKLAQWKAKVWEKTVKDIQLKHNKKPISCFLSYLYPHQVEEQAIREIQKMGIPCINFFCDNVREFTKAPKEFAVFDLNWVPEYKALSIYKKSEYKYIHLPMPVWVAPKYREITNIENESISFLGSNDIQRWILFEEIVKKGLAVTIYGNGWKNVENGGNKVIVNEKKGIKQLLINQLDFIKRYGFAGYKRKLEQKNTMISISSELEKCSFGKPIFGDDYFKVTKESFITIGVNRYPSYLHPLDKPDTYSRLRDIEAPMLGACYLTEWTEGIEEMYEIGKEIDVYRDAGELKVKVEQLLADKKKREGLRSAGQTKALSQHSIPISIKKIKKMLCLNLT